MNNQQRIDAFLAEQKRIAEASKSYIEEINKKHPITYMQGNALVKRFPDGHIQVIKVYEQV